MVIVFIMVIVSVIVLVFVILDERRMKILIIPLFCDGGHCALLFTAFMFCLDSGRSPECGCKLVLQVNMHDTVERNT